MTQPVIDLIGSGGFIGQAIQREAGPHRLRCWSHSATSGAHTFDLLDPHSWETLLHHAPHTVILLSWPGLPNYQQVFHITRNLPRSIELIDALIASGVRRLVIAGTCYEYGLRNGELHESNPTDPVNHYAIAKDTLRRVVSGLCTHHNVEWSWLRIFYPFGEGQNPNALIPSLRDAIRAGKPEFPMSSGRQLRDFIPVEQIAQHLLTLATHPDAHGIYNGGSGTPRALREVVEAEIAAHGSNIKPQLGAIPDRNDEPLAFWANTQRLNDLLNQSPSRIECSS